MKAAMGSSWPAEEYSQRSTIEEKLLHRSLAKNSDNSSSIILNYEVPSFTPTVNSAIVTSTTHTVGPGSKKGWSRYTRLDNIILFTQCPCPYASDVELVMTGVREKALFFGDVVAKRYGSRSLDAIPESSDSD